MPALNLLAAVPADATVVARACFADALDAAPVPADVLRRLGFEGKADQVQVLPSGEDGLLLLVGLGDRAKLTPAGLRKAGAQLTKAARKQARLTVAVLEDLAQAPPAAGAEPVADAEPAGDAEPTAGGAERADGDADADAATDAETAAAAPGDGAALGGDLQAEAQALVEGLLLAGYEFGGLKSEPSKTQLVDIDLVAPGDGARRAAAGPAGMIGVTEFMRFPARRPARAAHRSAVGWRNPP